MDKARLDALRARYGGGGGDIHDPEYASVAAKLFTGDRRVWPFAGVATFLGAPYLADSA